MPLVNGPIDWKTIDLVVFDVDGTLYDQNRLRARMLLQLIGSHDLDTLLTLRAFRQGREELAEHADDFRLRQYEMTATRRRRSVAHVQGLVEEWMEKRPLAFLPGCRLNGVDRLFDALRGAGKRIAIFSDYPIEAKLAALGLSADILVSACDAGVCRLKPDPTGLQRILEMAEVQASAALMIGDRVERDWEAARRIGMRALIRSRRALARIDTFQSFADEPFRPLLTTSA
jgi:phosphoglycolate phosphatase/putative hydrolase of the HAD superfamily